MIEKEKNNYFIDLYMSALRGFYSNQYLQSPKENSKRHSDLIKAREMVDQLEGDYVDFILFQFRVYKKFRAAPKPENLITESSIGRYITHQKLKNIYNTEVYFLNGDSFVVKKTNKTYPFTRILLPTNQDSLASFAYSVSPEKINQLLSEDTRDRIRESLAYLEAKLIYKKVPIPNSILDLLKIVGLN